MPLEILAPADDTITATMPGCRGMIDLPPATIVNQACADTLKWTVIAQFDTLNTNGGKAIFRLGVNLVKYIAMDTCGNMDMDTMFVTVVDSIPPVARCTGLRTVSLDGSGMAFIPASVFDGGSEESCFTYFKIKRLVPDTVNDCTTSDNPNFWFDDEVKFCCTDAGDTLDLILAVYDRNPGPGPVSDTLLADRMDTCIARVLILDKAPPAIVCPPDITIECGEHIDFDTLGLPTFTDNCDSISFTSFIERDIDQCGVGEFRRVIVGTDGGGLTDTCIQTITVVNNDPFDGLDTNQLRWPEPFVTIYGCLPVPDTSQAGGPVILEDECAMISVTWQDEVFQFSRGACSKVIRTFKVLDWCQYDPRVSSQCIPDNGCWTFEQVIKVVDTVAPLISRPADTTVAYLQPGCGSMQVDLDSATTDRCYPDEIITLLVEVDLDQDGSIDRTIQGGDASGIYPIGMHFLIYKATDACGNTTIDTMRLVIKDRVLPTPIAKTGLSTTLIDMGGGLIMVSIRAEQLNASSYDNCTDESNLIFSFSQDVNETEKTFDCDTKGPQTVELWVTDECGNQDFALITVFIGDEQNLCPTTSNFTSIGGQLSRHDGMSLQGAEIEISSGNDKHTVFSDREGNFLKDQLERNETYVIKPKMATAPTDGISVGDLVMIQRYLLGRTSFDQTHQFLSADADMSGFISTRDISELRKVLLGKTTGLRHGKEWLFIPKNFKFKDPMKPLDEVWPEKYTISNIGDPENIDFEGYRLGDIDQSYGNVNGVQTRGEEVPVRFEYRDDGSIDLHCQSEVWIQAMQLSVQLTGEWDGDVIIESEIQDWSADHFHFDPKSGELKILYMNIDDPTWVPGDGVMLTIHTGSDIQRVKGSLLSTNENVIMISDQFYQVKEANHVMNVGQLTVSASPNPFQDQLILDIFSNRTEKGNFSIRNILGHQIMQQDIFLNRGWNTIELDGRELANSGIYFITVKSGEGESEIKVVRGI